MNKLIQIAMAGILLVSSTNMSLAKDWWQDSFIKEGSGICEGNDSIRTFSATKMEGWETSCKITKQQKIKDIDAIVLDYECGGNDLDPEITKPRELVVKLQDGIRIFPGGAKFQYCASINPYLLPQSTPKSADCPIDRSLMQSDTRDDGTYQVLQFTEGYLQGRATLTGYKNNEAIWTTRPNNMCSNGSVICRLSFRTRAGEEYEEAFQPLMVNSRPWAVFAELRQTLYMKERDATYYRKAYGGIEVDFLNGYKPADDEMILPENVYKFSGCSAAETRAE